MKKFYKIIFLITFLIMGTALLSSCSGKDDEPETDDKENTYNKDEFGNYINERLILIYAIAANNLEPNLGYDMQEILDIAPSLNLKNNKILIYSVVKSGECLLQELAGDSRNGYYFETIKEFADLPLSTDSVRIEEVIGYVKNNFDFQRYGLVLWSHADGWIPWFAGSNPAFEKRRSFGWDNYEGATYKTNINSLAGAIPENMFDFIWFDCCYMANIETVYQLRDKADYIVGSVLEIASDGMPYNLTIPYLLRKEADLEKSAYEFFRYYNDKSIAVSVSIMDLSQSDFIAEAARNIISYGKAPESSSLTDIQTYQRNLSVKFYDMGQLLDKYTDIDVEASIKLNDAFGAFVIYKRISDFDFNHRPINTREYSGLSMHNFINNGTADNEYYKTLDWYKATR